MAKLSSRSRTQLRDADFAYVDPAGRRRLPIHDESHVRNALSRFNQVTFEDEAARDQARTRLLKAAKRYGIVPIGFMDGQIRGRARSLPSGTVTLLMTDIVDSTGLLNRLEDRYPSLLADLRRLIRTVVRRYGGVEVDARGDEFFAAFATAGDAVSAGMELQDTLAGRAWPDGATVMLRAGIHRGRPTQADGSYVGIAVHAVKRICSAASGGQVVVSRAALGAIDGELMSRLVVVDLGRHSLKGLPEAEHLFVVRPRPATFRGLQVIGFAHPRSDLRRRLVDLVMAGTKTATAGLLVELELDGEQMPVAGMREVVIDAEDRYVGEIETIECRVLRMADVDDRFARDEGEGFADAAAWREAHERFWSAYLHEIRDRLGDASFSLTDDTQVICQRFRLAERYPEPILA